MDTTEKEMLQYKKGVEKEVEESVKRFYKRVAHDLDQLMEENIITETTPALEVLIICRRKGALK